MITYGVLVLIIGLIVWGIGAGFGVPPLLVVGKVIGAIGLVLLIVGLILLIVPAGGIQVHDALALLG